MKHDCMDAGGRATHGAVAEEARTEEHDSKEGGGRVMHGAITELPRCARAATVRISYPSSKRWVAKQ